MEMKPLKPSEDDEKAAWVESLVDEYEKPLCGYAYNLLRDPDRARDAVQETFLRLCKEPRSKLAGHEAGWLFRVCRSRALDILRKEKPVNQLSEEQQAVLPSDTAGPSEQAQQQDLMSRLPSLLNQLPERQGEVIRLKFQQHLSYKEIADALEISVSNVGFLIHTGLKTLRSDFNALEGAHS